MRLSHCNDLKSYKETAEDKLHNKVVISKEEVLTCAKTVYRAYNDEPTEGEVTDFYFYYEDGYAPEWA